MEGKGRSRTTIEVAVNTSFTELLLQECLLVISLVVPSPEEHTAWKAVVIRNSSASYLG